MKTTKINIEKEVLEDLFINQNLTIKEISKKFNCSVDTVRRRLQKFGLKTGTSYKPPVSKVDPLQQTKDKIKQLYLSGKSCKQIGEIVNLSEKTVSYHLHKMNVPTRSNKKMDQSTFETLWKNGLSDEEIAEQFEVAVNTVKSFRTRGENKGKFVQIQHFSQTEQQLTYEQEQFILGSLLGDMNISNPGSTKRAKNSRIYLVHSVKQKDLFMKKVEILGDFMGSWKLQTPPPDKRTGKIYQTYRGNTKAHKVFTDIWNIVYPNGHKTITDEYLNRINSPIALAYWFMDDGTYQGNFATHSFSEQEVDLLINWLNEKWQIVCSKQKNVQNKIQYIIHVSSKSRKHFEELIFPYMVESMYYKLKYANELLENAKSV